MADSKLTFVTSSRGKEKAAIYIAPLEWVYSEALSTPPLPNNVVLSCRRNFWENTLWSLTKNMTSYSWNINFALFFSRLDPNIYLDCFHCVFV